MYLKLNKNTESILKAIRQGYGGVFEDGALADRRQHENLHVLQADESLGIPQPVIHNPNCVNGWLHEGDWRKEQKVCEWCHTKQADKIAISIGEPIWT